MMFQLMFARSYRKRPFYEQSRSLCRVTGAFPYFLTRHCLRAAESPQSQSITSPRSFNGWGLLRTRWLSSLHAIQIVVVFAVILARRFVCGLSVMGREGIRIHTEVDRINGTVGIR